MDYKAFDDCFDEDVFQMYSAEQEGSITHTLVVSRQEDQDCTAQNLINMGIVRVTSEEVATHD